MMEFAFKLLLCPELVPSIMKRIGQYEGVRFCTCDLIKDSSKSPTECTFKIIVHDTATPMQIYNLGQKVGGFIITINSPFFYNLFSDGEVSMQMPI